MRERDQRVVVITGASAGVGRALARRFGRDRASVGLIARGIDGLEAAKREIEALGGRALVVPCDVADADAVDAAAARVEAELGPIDVWINNAMVSVFAPVDAITPAEFRRVTEVTYLGVVHGTLAALKRMKPRGSGTIVQTGSALAYRGIPLQSAYCAAKHAIQGFNDSLRCELLHDRAGVRVSMVQLPAVNTPQFDWSRSKMAKPPQPLGAIYQPEVAAEAIHRAALEGKREYILGWSSLEAILGNDVVPDFADHRLAATAYDGQQADRPLPRERPDNLFAPVAGDHGAHGGFDDRARTWSSQWWLRGHLEGVAAVVAAGALALSLLLPPRRRRARPRVEMAMP